MYVARFSYGLLPINRQQGIEFVRKEVEAAVDNGLKAVCWCRLRAAKVAAPLSNSRSSWQASIDWTSSGAVVRARQRTSRSGCMHSVNSHCAAVRRNPTGRRYKTFLARERHTSWAPTAAVARKPRGSTAASIHGKCFTTSTQLRRRS